MRYLKVLGGITAATLLLLIFWPKFATAASSTLYLTTPNPSVLSGSTFAVTIHEDSGVDAINAAQANLTYPSAQLSVQSVTVASGWSQAQNDTSTAGTILFAAYPSPAGSTLTGDQAIATIVFQVTSPGSVAIGFGCTLDASTCPNGNALVRASDNSTIIPAQYPLNINNDHLSSPQTLTSGQYLSSPNDLYRLVMQTDGNFVLYGWNLRPLWASNTTGLGANRAVLQADGNLVLYTPSNKPVWASNTGGVGSSNMLLQGDGNLVLYKSNWQVTWATGTGGHSQPAYFGSDRMVSGQALNLNQYIESSDGRYAVLLQSDGNLVLYSAGYHVLWASGTGGRPGSKLIMQSDGNLVLYTASNSPIWSTNSGGVGLARAIVQTDGNFVVYKSSYSPVWASNTSGTF